MSTTQPKTTKKKAKASGPEPTIAEAGIPQVKLEEQAVVPLRRKLPTAVSYSRLTTYDKCSEMYRLKYVQGIPESREDTVATRQGSICHTALEAFYLDGGASIESPYHALTRDGGVWDDELKSSGLTMLKRELQTYAHHMTKLHWRASAQYTGPDKIRKADGTVSTAAHMTTAWKTYVKANALDRMANHIDQVAVRACPERWQGISLSEVYSATLGFLYPYRNPQEIAAVVAIELPISDIKLQGADVNGLPLFEEDGVTPVPTSRTRGPHPVYQEPVEGGDGKKQARLIEIENEFYLPALGPDGKLARDEAGNVLFRDDILFNGYIDMVSRDDQGRLYLIDHKTSKELPSPAKVARHEQLLLYGFIVHHLFGETPYAIGINHLRSGQLVTAPFDLAKAEMAVERLAAIVHGVEKGVFIKKDPDAYMATCVIKSYKDGEPPTLCPGLRYCHPDVFAQHTRSLDNLDF